MKNNIIPANSVKESMRRLLPDGLSEDVIKKIPALVARINEVERAMEPFARAYEANKRFKTELVSVYKRDLQLAADMMNPKNSVPIPKKNYEYPAR